MAKHGHVKGQGLGASGSGIAQPLVMERVKAPKAPKAPKGAEAEVPKGAKGMGIGGKAMGKLVNANAEEKNRAQLEKYGESSRIVVLTNMVGIEDVDEDLQTEIGALTTCRLESLKLTPTPDRRGMLKARSGRASPCACYASATCRSRGKRTGLCAILGTGGCLEGRSRARRAVLWWQNGSGPLF